MKRILHLKKWVLSAISLVSYTTLILIFVYGKTESVLVYPIYCMSAYSLVAFSVAVPDVIRKTAQHLQKSRLMRWVLSSKIADRYLSDVAFRGNISIYQGMTVNFLYMIFRAVTGMYYTSVWSISIAVYYLILGVIRAYLVICYKYRDNKDESICYLESVFVKYFNGWYDYVDDKDKFWIFLPGICDLSFGIIYFLYFDNCS